MCGISRSHRQCTSFYASISRLRTLCWLFLLCKRTFVPDLSYSYILFLSISLSIVKRSLLILQIQRLLLLYELCIALCTISSHIMGMLPLMIWALMAWIFFMVPYRASQQLFCKAIKTDSAIFPSMIEKTHTLLQSTLNQTFKDENLSLQPP